MYFYTLTQQLQDPITELAQTDKWNAKEIGEEIKGKYVLVKCYTAQQMQGKHIFIIAVV
jgi:hypothetical protein